MSWSKLSNNPVLAFADFKVPFILTTDPSIVGIGAVLSQVQEGSEAHFFCEPAA
jgi:hypothetical protein